MEKSSIYQAGEQEADSYKWIRSEEVGHDLGEVAVHEWMRKHWNGFLRARWLEHLQGKRFWEELDRGDFGLVQNRFHDRRQLLAQIIDHLKCGRENLDIIVWALDTHQPLAEVCEILEVLDINSRRLSHRFEVR